MTDDMTKQFRPYPKKGKKLPKCKRPLPKRSKKNKPATKAEKAHLAWVKVQPCICCRLTGHTEVHHICEGGRRLGHKFTLPLCGNYIDPVTKIEHQGCHEGNALSIGNHKKSFIAKYGTELQLLAKLRGVVWMKEELKEKSE